VLAAAVCFVFMMSGLEIIQSLFRGWAPAPLADLIAGMSLLQAFDQSSDGVIDARHLVLPTANPGMAGRKIVVDHHAMALPDQPPVKTLASYWSIRAMMPSFDILSSILLQCFFLPSILVSGRPFASM
jgi:hypothetical protein